MRKISIGLSVVAAALAFAMILSVVPGAMATGNGAPSGAHYNLNIIGMSKDKQAGDMTNDGHRIFVDLYGKGTKIWLQAGDSFNVLDADGTDGSARLQMLDPYPGTTNTSTYQIYVRALGKPGGSSTLTSGFLDADGSYWYSLENVTMTRSKGKSVFSDKTLELTTVYADITNDGVYNPLRYNLFDNATYNYFWNYDNNGMKLLQLRMYAV
jgi:hypothetical protein